MYTKDFASLLQLLDLSQQSGTLFVEREGEPWQAQLQLQEGKLLSCSLLSIPDNQTLLLGSQAVDWLLRRGELQWRLEEHQGPAEGALVAPPPLPEPSPSQGMHLPGSISPQHRGTLWTQRASRLIPRRTNVQMGRSFAWKRDTLRVFALIDGVRSLDEIARLLNKSLEEVFPILQELAAKGYISLAESG